VREEIVNEEWPSSAQAHGQAGTPGGSSGDTELLQALGRRFSRREPREAMVRYVRGLSAPVLRKNAWTLANLAGSGSPDSMQRLLRTAQWDISGVRDDLRAEFLARLGGEQRLWILDETAFRKRGNGSVGVERQYMRTARRLENCQIGVFLMYATSRGHALVDRELYLPTTWIDSPDRRHRARVPDDVATSPERDSANRCSSGPTKPASLTDG